ncbi:MAG: TonB-dependent receptor plug domain-containing protein [Bacteroidales bacterium]|nr:TonB-dependent receptor plug domain-containing protein [Bacteroidales bacterium]
MNKLLHILLLLFIAIFLHAQDKKNIAQFTKDDVLELTYDELLEMPFEDVIELAEIVGVSLEDLIEMLLNKDVVSASKKIETNFEAPLSTSVISYDEIVSSGARSIEEALRLVPGLIVREKTNGNFDIHIRGNDNLPAHHLFVYSENSISLVMIDGRPVYNYVHGGTFWETLPIGLADIDRIEVIRGPSSALYGPNAVSGVVNIITKRQTEEKLSVTGNVQAGAQKTVISDFSVGKKINKYLSFRATSNFETLNRNTDKLYVHRFNKKEWGYLTKQQLDTLRTFSPLENEWFNVFDPHDDINAMYPSPILARQRFGANGYLVYRPKKDVCFDLKGGYQYSQVLSTTMGDNPTSYAGRVSNTQYADFVAMVKGLKVQTNILSGWQDIVRCDTGFKVDILNLNTNLEYDINYGNLNLKPGFAFQLAGYNDLPYLRRADQGFLNGEKSLWTTAISLRADYLIREKIRLIGAIRGEGYNTHNKMYLSYQSVLSYKLNNVHHFRIVASKANRSPFLLDSYADFLWNRDGRPMPGYIQYNGQKNIDLLTMRTIEIGYRIKPVKNVQADIEFFVSKTKNFGALYPDSLNLNGFSNASGRPYVSMLFGNIGLESEQSGVTYNLSWIPDKNIVLRFFGTYQQTSLQNVISFSPDSAIVYMFSAAMSGSGYSTHFPDERDQNINNVSTPEFYGGIVAEFKLFNQKLTLASNLYAYSKHELQTKYGQQQIDEKFVLNLNGSYKLLNNKAKVSLNIRNLLGKKREFAYMDEIGRLFLLGLSITL